MIKTIFIDWYKTLSSSNFWEHLESTQKMLFDDIIFSLYVKNKSLINDWMRGKLTTKDVLGIVNKDTKVEVDFLHTELVKSCKNMQFDSPLFLDLIGKIRSKGIKVVIATDNMDVFRRYTIPAMNLEKYFDGFLISNELRVLKSDISPNKFQFFHDYMTKNKLKYNETILIDDSLNNSECCKKFGMNNQIIDRPERVIEVLANLIRANPKKSP